MAIIIHFRYYYFSIFLDIILCLYKSSLLRVITFCLVLNRQYLNKNSSCNDAIIIIIIIMKLFFARTIIDDIPRLVDKQIELHPQRHRILFTNYR